MIFRVISHIKNDFRKVETDEKSLKKFGIVVGVIFVIIAAFSTRDLIWIGLPGAILIILGVFRPYSLYYPYLAWMMIAVIMGFFMTRILLVVLYYFAILPIGLLKRVFGESQFFRSFDKEVRTYWIAPEKGVFSKEDLEHLY